MWAQRRIEDGELNHGLPHSGLTVGDSASTVFFWPVVPELDLSLRQRWVESVMPLNLVILLIQSTENLELTKHGLSDIFLIENNRISICSKRYGFLNK